MDHAEGDGKDEDDEEDDDDWAEDESDSGDRGLEGGSGSNRLDPSGLEEVSVSELSRRGGWDTESKPAPDSSRKESSESNESGYMRVGDVGRDDGARVEEERLIKKMVLSIFCRIRGI